MSRIIAREYWIGIFFAKTWIREEINLGEGTEMAFARGKWHPPSVCCHFGLYTAKRDEPDSGNGPDRWIERKFVVVLSWQLESRHP